MKKLGAVFYIILAVLTVGVLGMLAAWLWTDRELFLYLMLALFPVYLFHLIFNLAMNGRRERREKERRSEFLALAGNAEKVYITYLGNERRVGRPSAHRKDYLIEFYAKEADAEALKRHLWYGLAEAEEERLRLFFLGGGKYPYPLLADLKHKQIFVQGPFYRAAEGSPLFHDILKSNEWILYGDDRT